MYFSVSYHEFKICKSILVFPPWISSFRFLAHKFVDEYFFPELCSFSVGHDDKRRVIVGLAKEITRFCLPYSCIHKKLFSLSQVPETISSCICSTRIKLLLAKDVDFARLVASYQTCKKINFPEYNYSSKKMAAVKDNNGISYRDRHKRPDKQLYVPRALRKVESTSGMKRQNFDINSSNNDFERKEICMKRIQSSFSDKGMLFLEKCDKLKPDLNCTGKSVDKNFVSKHINVNNLDSVQIESTGMKYDELDKCIDTKKLEEKIVKDLKTSIHCPETIVPKDLSEKTSKTEQPKLNIDEVCAKKECFSENLAKLQQNNQVDSYQSLDGYTSPKQYEDRMKDCDIQDEASGEEDSWENMFNDDGDCIDPKFIKELTHIAGRMQLTVAKNDYSDYKSVSGSVSEEYNNMVELYGFPVEFTTQDLTSAFSVFQKASYTIKWVDDCHALAIFSSPVIANQALHLNHPFVKVRPLSEGIKESKTKARLCDHLSEEPKPRPATSAALARRLVTGALGLKVHTSKEQRDIERNMLKEAREKKKLKAKQRQDIWNGIVS